MASKIPGVAQPDLTHRRCFLTFRPRSTPRTASNARAPKVRNSSLHVGRTVARLSYTDPEDPGGPVPPRLSSVLVNHGLPFARRLARRRMTAARTTGRPPKEAQWA